MNKMLALMVKEGNLKEVKKLFPKKSNSKSRPGEWTAEQATETVDRRGQNILHLAVEANQMEIVRFLIEGQSMGHNTVDKSGWTPLHIACAAGNLEMIEYLVLRVGVDVNLVSVDQSTPLHYFVRHVPPPQIEAGSSSTLRRHNVHDRSEARKSLFGLRRLRSEEDLMGGNGSQSDTYFRVLGALLHQKGRESLINAKNKNGDTPLHTAATRGSPHVLTFLIQRNANINALNKYELHLRVGSFRM
jgi:ankyrin repeat protein